MSPEKAAMSKISQIEISFPLGVELTNDDQRALIAIASRICDRYEAENPSRVMWPFGVGQKMLADPVKLSDDEPIPFDDNCFQITCSERENYDWLCAKCGHKQGDHKECIVNPPAGACDFEPKPKPESK